MDYNLDAFWIHLHTPNPEKRLINKKVRNLTQKTRQHAGISNVKRLSKYSDAISEQDHMTDIYLYIIYRYIPVKN